MVIVQKYGGSSLRDVPSIGQVADRVVHTVKQGHQVVVVVSAMGNTTNELLALAKQVSASPGRRELDLLISVGERVSMTLLAMAIQERGVAAASFTGSQTGIITDGNHARAQVVEVRPHRIQKALDEDKVAIVAGFQGVSRHGDVTTLGRGGSDTTAVVLTAALKGAYCEICSDVDGVYTADPRKVPKAQRLDVLPLDAAIRLAEGGAKVLLDDALRHAREHGVVLMASATGARGGGGTRLPPGPIPEEVVGVASLDDAVLVDQIDGERPVVAWPSKQGPRFVVSQANRHQETQGLQKVCVVTAVGRSFLGDSRLFDAIDLVQQAGTLHWMVASDALVAVMPEGSQVVGSLHDLLVVSR